MTDPTRPNYYCPQCSLWIAPVNNKCPKCGHPWLPSEDPPRYNSLTATPDPAVNHPPHYTHHPSGIECIEVTRHMSFNLGNAIKYIWRFPHRANVEDLRKAIWYLEDEIRRVET